MEKNWRNLIIIAIVFFLISIGWEVISVLEGTRSKETITIVEMPRGEIFTEPVKNFLLN